MSHKIEFNWKVLRPGDILEEANSGRFCRLIMYALGSHFGHDSGVVLHIDGNLYIGESVGISSKLTPIREWEEQMSAGKIRVRTIRPLGASPSDGLKASHWWNTNVEPRPYDWFAYPRFAGKAVLKAILRLFGEKVDDLPDWFPSQAGVEWAFYCTEGWREAWEHGAAIDPWGKNNGTPRTTEKRVEEGKMVVIPGLLIDGQEACDTAHVDFSIQGDAP